MFSKTNSPQTTSSATPETPRKPVTRSSMSAPSILGRDLIITGDIKTDGDVQIDGRHEGNVSASTLTVGEQGAINGKISAKTVYVRGKVTGMIEASLVELSETANVQADIIQDQLTIANGAFFDGKCSRRKKPSIAGAGSTPKPAISPKKPA